MATTLEMLLAALSRGGDLPGVPRPAPSAPIPLAPVPILGPLSTETTAAFGALNPEPVPPALPRAAPPDMGFVNQYAGAEPVAPTRQPTSTLQRIMLALQGFGAGVQGQGPQFLAQLREQRERPIREYQRQLEQFGERRTRGLEIAERRAEREQDRAQRALENQYEREFQTWVKKTGVRDLEARDRMRQAFDIQKIREQERIADERQAVRDKAQQERDARTISGRLGSGPGAAPAKIADELGRFYANLTEKLSPAAENWRNAQARRADILASRAAGGGGMGGGNAVSLERQFNALKARFLRAELGTPQAPRGDRALMERIATQFTAVMDKLAKLGYEVGFDPSGIYPYIKPPRGRSAPTQPAAPQGQQADPLGIR